MLPTKFGVNWPFGSGEEGKNRFSRWRPWWPSWNSDWNDFSYFWSTSYPYASYQVSSQLAFGIRKRKIDFQDGRHGGHLRFTIGTISAIFDLQVTSMLPSKFGVNWPFGSGEEVKNRFSRRPPWRISDQHDFSYFLIYKSPWCFLASLESVGLSVQERKRKIDFQDGRHGGHLGFTIGTILAIFDL